MADSIASVTRATASAGALMLMAKKFVVFLFQYLGSSDYLGGMIAMSAMGVVRDAVQLFFKHLRSYIVRCLWVSISLGERDAELLLAWLRERPEVHASPQLALFSRGGARGDARQYEYEPEIQASTCLRYESKQRSNHWLWITRKETDDSDSHSERRFLGVQVSFFGLRSKFVVEEILDVGRDIERRKREKHLSVVQVYDFGGDYGLGWLHPQESDRKQPGRSIASVVLPKCSGFNGVDQAEALLEDARDFLNSESWYSERGIPYRRGYLLHGVPGGGKSSLIMAVASELRLPIYMLQLSSEFISDETLNSLFQHGMHDPPTIVLLEDVDLLHSVALKRNENQQSEREECDRDETRQDSEPSKRRRKAGRLSLSGLLNALDGPTATTGRLLFMTTNAKHRLDPVLIRSGRIDYEVEFKFADHEQICRFVSRFYTDFETARSSSDASSLRGDLARVADAAGRFADEVEASEVEVTTADIQRHLMKHKKDIFRALQELPSFLEIMRSTRESVAGNTRPGSAVPSEASSPDKMGSVDANVN